MRLHIGSGATALPGWVNVDRNAYPGVDVTLDVRQGLPFRDVEFIFAEHFLEHLTLAEGLLFLRECRRVLSESGVLRLSTPNLDWVWMTHYKPPESMTDEERLVGCLEMNRAFHGWGHQFLYNLHTLTLTLRESGFQTIVSREYGVSEIRELCGLERHERHADRPGAPSVLVVEACGSSVEPAGFEERIAQYVRDAAAH